MSSVTEKTLASVMASVQRGGGGVSRVWREKKKSEQARVGKKGPTG